MTARTARCPEKIAVGSAGYARCIDLLAIMVYATPLAGPGAPMASKISAWSTARPVTPIAGRCPGRPDRVTQREQTPAVTAAGSPTNHHSDRSLAD
jgi:hypothetical protein